MVNYGLYKGTKNRKQRIKVIRGNPRSPLNQKKLVVWDDSKKGVEKWIGKWGTKTQKMKFLK